VDREQADQLLDQGNSTLIANGQPQELSAAGQIADGEQIGIHAVNGRTRSVKVGGPNAAGSSPVEHMDGLFVQPFPQRAIAAQDILQGGAREVGKEVAQRRQADAGPQFVDDVNHFITLPGRGGAERSAQRMERHGSCGAVVLPDAQSARRYFQVVRGLLISATVFDQAATDGNSVPASEPFDFTLAALTGYAIRSGACRLKVDTRTSVGHESRLDGFGRLRFEDEIFF